MNTTVKRSENSVWYYGSMEPAAVGELCYELHQAKCVQDVVYLHLCSGGGDVYSGLAAGSVVRRLGMVTVIVEGACESSAIHVLLSAERRWMTRESYILVHPAQHDIGTTAQDIQDEARFVQQIHDQLATLVMSRTKANAELCRQQKRLRADEALDLGFIDEIV